MDRGSAQFTSSKRYGEQPYNRLFVLVGEKARVCGPFLLLEHRLANGWLTRLIDDIVVRRPVLWGAVPSACRRCGASFTVRLRGRGGCFCSSRCRGRWHQARREAALSELEQVVVRAPALIRELRGSTE